MNSSFVMVLLSWVRAAGNMERFSEQQLTDCSWKFGANHACDGGVLHS